MAEAGGAIPINFDSESVVERLNDLTGGKGPEQCIDAVGMEAHAGPDSAQASWSERLILPAKCGACIQHDKRAVNDRSLIDTGRGTMVNPP
jgi:threonine dehydrogenase-like Zn-dependent dehydrogenase